MPLRNDRDVCLRSMMICFSSFFRYPSNCDSNYEILPDFGITLIAFNVGDIVDLFFLGSALISLSRSMSFLVVSLHCEAICRITWAVLLEIATSPGSCMALVEWCGFLGLFCALRAFIRPCRVEVPVSSSSYSVEVPEEDSTIVHPFHYLEAEVHNLYHPKGNAERCDGIHTGREKSRVYAAQM